MKTKNKKDKKISGNKATKESRLLTKGEKAMGKKEYYTVSEVAEAYGKDESHVRKELKVAKIETIPARREADKKVIQVLSHKDLLKFISNLKWSEVNVDSKEITVTDAMRELGLHVENQRKTFNAKLALIGATVTVKNVGKGKEQPVFDKKFMKLLKDIFTMPSV